MHALAALAVVMAQLPLGFGVILTLVVVVSFTRIRQWNGSDGLVLHARGGFEKVGAGGAALVLDASSTSLGSVWVLRYTENGAMRSMVLFSDNFIDPKDMRRFMRWYLHQARSNEVSGPG